jgi:hypothetical protein
MREDHLRERITSALHEAKDARVRHDQGARETWLEQAWADARTLGDASLLSATCWRLAKARYDRGAAEGLIEALAPMVQPDIHEIGEWGVKQAVGPFDHYEPGLRALAPLCRRHWDHLGYASEVVDKLWLAYSEAQRKREDPFLAAWGDVQRSWQLACAGRSDELAAMVATYARLSPGRFGTGPHRHPRAEDVPTSIYWVQLDLARTLLHAATWAHDERRTWEAMELVEDAAEDCGLDRHTDFWFLDTMLHAAGRFGRAEVVERYLPAYRNVLEGSSPELPAVHRLRGQAWLAFLARQRSTAQERAIQALDQARHHRAGPEWVVECALLAAIASDAGQSIALRAVAREEAARTSVVMHDLAGLPAA